MKLLVLTAVFAVASSIDYEEDERKYHKSMADMFEEHLLPFNKRIALEANYYTRGHFIISPHNIWYTLGTVTHDHKDLYSFLNLPDDDTVRRQLLSRALALDGSTEHISFSRSQAIAVDETIDVSKNWTTFDNIPFSEYGMPEYIPSLKYRKPFGRVQSYVENYQPVPYSSHTVLLDNFLFDISIALPDKVIFKGPFYNKQGDVAATVDYLKFRGKFRVGHFAESNVKIVEVPLSDNSSMLLATGGEAEDMIKEVFSGHIFSELKLTEEPIEVVFPRLYMTSSAIEMGSIFDNMRRSKTYSHPPATSNLQTTGQQQQELLELLRGYYHIVTVNVTESLEGSTSNSKDSSEEITDFAALEKEGFVVNRPFLFAVFVPIYQTDVKVPIITGVYSYPGERGQQKIFEEIIYFD